jgi:hypothetical protein
MNDMNPRAIIGGNLPPDPLDEALATDPEALELAEGLLTGDPVTTEAQMKAVDAVTKRLKALKKAVTTAKETESKPLHDAWKAALAKYKPTEVDLDQQIEGCISMVDDFKRNLAAKKADAERKARAEAEAAARAAHEAAQLANPADLEAVRAADQAKRDAEDAAKAVRIAAKDAASVGGMRTVTRFEVTDHRALLHWIAVNRRDDLTAFIDKWALTNHKTAPMADGLRVWTEKEAF